MARKLAHDADPDEAGPSDCTSESEQEKSLLNRREYVQLAATATAVTMGAGASVTGAASSENNLFITDFSEYAQ